MEWMFEVACERMVDLLRSEAPIEETLPKSVQTVKAWDKAVQEAFADTPQLRDLCKCFEALRVLFESAAATAAADQSLPHAPSALKSALDDLTSSAPERGPLALAVQYGQLGVHVCAEANRQVMGNSRDEVASANLDKASADLASATAPFDSNALVAAIQSIESSFHMMGKGTRERRASDVAAAIARIAALEVEWAATIESKLGVGIRAEAHLVKDDIVAALVQASGPSSTLESPSGVLETGAAGQDADQIAASYTKCSASTRLSEVLESLEASVQVD